MKSICECQSAVFTFLVASLQQRNLTNTVARPSIRVSDVTRELKCLQLVDGKANLYQILCEAS